MNFLKGKKTYLVALLMVLYAAFGLLLGDLNQEKTIHLVLEALGLAGLRNAIT